MKKLMLVCIALVASTTFYSCDKDETTTTPNNNNNNNNNTPLQGKGAMTVVCNGQTFVNAGNCNYSSSADCIVVADSNSSSNVFTLNLDNGLPTTTKTYTIADVASGSDTVSMSFARFPSSSTMYDWETLDGAGTVTLTVDGNKITCTLNNVPMDGNDFYNPTDLEGAATCSGSFTLYK